MGQCYQCGGYMEWSGTCPACKRNDELAQEQRNIAFDVAQEEERAKERLQHDAHVKEVLRKLIDLAVESVEDPVVAEKKILVIMQSATFRDNEEDYLGEITANPFLSDIYFCHRIGKNPTVSIISSLPITARNAISKWASNHSDSSYAQKVIDTYRSYREQKTAEEKQEEDKRKKQELLWKEESAKREADRIKRAKEEEAKVKIKKTKDNFFAFSLATLTSIIFVTGFITGGMWKVNKWIQEDSYYSNWFVAFFCIACIISIYAYFKSSAACFLEIINKRYYNDYKVILRWSSIILLLIVTIFNWKTISGAERMVMLTLSGTLHFIPYIRGVLGTFGVGVGVGLISLIFSYLIGGLFGGAYNIIMK